MTEQIPEQVREVALVQALRDVVNPLGYLQRYADERGTVLNGSAYAIANDLGFVQKIASDALRAHEGEG